MQQAGASWVYYRRLLRDAVKPKQRLNLLDIHKEGMEAVSNATFAVDEHANSNNGQILISMGQNELSKELSLLNQIFHANINLDLTQPGSIKILIDTLNACLNLKSVYERNKSMIVNYQGKKAAYTYFATYLNQALDSLRTEIRDELIKRFRNKEDFGKSAVEVINDKFDNRILPKAIELALSVEDPGIDKSSLNAYKDIIAAIQKFPNNPMAAGLKSAWGLDKIVNEMTQNVIKAAESEGKAGISGFFKTKKSGLSEIKSKIRTKTTNNSSGLSLEALYDQILAMVAGNIPDFTASSGNFTLQGDVQAKALSQVGRMQMRPDHAVIFRADASPVEKMLSEKHDNRRETAVNLFNQISSYINDINDGFIVYTNTKNYDLGDGFSGFSAGRAISLEMLEGQLGNFIDNVDNLIIVLLNAGAGAISEGNTGESSKILAQAVAFALFDDWNFIGNTSGGGSSIHVMNLNGVLIPLSAFLFSLGKAIEDAEKNPSAFVSVNVKTASYPVKNNSDVYGKENWLNAVDLGKRNTKISYHFMRNIRSFLSF